MFKRGIYVLLCLAFALTFAACGGKKEDEEEETAAKPAKSTATAANAALPAAAAPAAGGATITGKVAFAGTAPAKEQIKMDADAYCKGAHSEPVYTQEVVVNPNGTLEWVLVYVKEGVTGSYPPPADAGHARPERVHVPSAHLRDPGGAAAQDRQQRRDPPQHPRAPEDQRRVQHRAALPEDGDAEEVRQGRDARPLQVRRAQVDGRVLRRLQPPLLRDDERPGDLRDQEPAPRATTSSRPGRRSTARRRRT